MFNDDSSHIANFLIFLTHGQFLNFSYIKDIKDEILESKSKKYNNVNHPLNAFHVIRRFVTAWQEVFNQVGNFTNYNGKNRSTLSIYLFNFYLGLDSMITGKLFWKYLRQTNNCSFRVFLKFNLVKSENLWCMTLMAI